MRPNWYILWCFKTNNFATCKSWVFCIKSPLCDPIMLFLMTCTKNKLISQFSVDFDVSFVSYAQFAVILMLHYIQGTSKLGNLKCRHEFINRRLGDYFTKEMNMKHFEHKYHVPKGFYMCLKKFKKINFCGEKWGMRMWIMKWTFKNVKKSYLCFQFLNNYCSFCYLHSIQYCLV